MTLGRLAHAATALDSILSAAIVVVAIGVLMRLRGSAPGFLRGLCLSPSRGGLYLLSMPALVSMTWATFVLSVLALAFWLFGPQYTFNPSIYEYKRQGVGSNAVIVSIVFSLAAGVLATLADKQLTGRPGVGAAPGTCSYYVTPGAPDGSDRQLPPLATGANILPAVSAAYAASDMAAHGAAAPKV